MTKSTKALRTEVRPATEEDCRSVVDLMTEEQKDVIRRGWGCDPLEGVLASWRLSGTEAYAGLVGGVPAVVFGVRAVGLSSMNEGDFEGNGEGLLWLESNPLLDRAKIRFIRETPGYFQYWMLEFYDRLSAYASWDNGALTRWLQFMGFSFTFVVGSREFYKATLTREAFNRWDWRRAWRSRAGS
jgi:hypothetical protein